MKTILTTLLFFALLVNTSAQELASLDNDLDSIYSLDKKSYKSSSKSMKRLDTQLIKNQIQAYLSENLVYPEILRDYRMSGELILEVSFKRNGEIMSYKVINSTNRIFNKLVTDTFSNFDSLNLNKKEYCGAFKIEIPIKFSI